MPPKHRDGDIVAAFSGAWISWAHTIVAYAAFLGALIVGVSLHYHKIVENEHYGYPVEWFPSVSATIGDRYPERSVFQVFIAITSGPRFALCALWYCLSNRPNSTLPKFVAGVGIFRTFTCGGWTYVTSTDDHGWHDIFMISYLVATIPWTVGCVMLSPPNPKAIQYRKAFAYAFFGTLVPLIYFFIQHKVHKVPGAYTIYAFFEWALVLLDVAFDAVTAIDFGGLELIVKDVTGASRGYVQWLPNDKPRVADKIIDDKKDKEVGKVFGTGFQWSEMIDALADVYNGYVFWSIQTSLGLVVWYFPLWYMGISGFEAFVMSTVSPLLLGIAPIRRFVIRNLSMMRLLTLSGLVAWLIKDPVLRLTTIGFAVAMGCMTWAATFYAERSQPGRLESRVCGLAIGLILSSVAKFANHSNNPIWPVMNADNGGWNVLGLALAILATLRSVRWAPISSPDVPHEGGSSYLAALGLAGLFFHMHFLLSDSGTMISWVWEGWPIRGPIAAHGSLTLLFMGLGLAFGLFYPQFTRSWTMFGVGSIGSAILTTKSHWTGYYGALILTSYIMALSPVLIASAVRYSPARTFGFGFLIYNILVLFSVWIVAYAFVPGGPLVRERTDWLMTLSMICVGCGVFAAQNLSSSQNSRSMRKPPNPAARRQRSYYIYILMGLQLFSFATTYLRFPTFDYKPAHPNYKSITAGIWTIHFALDNPMYDSARRMRDLIAELEIDVIGLLESDTQRIIMGNRDDSQFLAEDLGMYVDFGPGPNKHTWGAALLSKFPIVNSTHHLLPSPVGELAPAIEATLDCYGEMVDVFVFHSGQEEDPEDRRLQSEYLSRIMKATPRPAILLSYLVIKPGEGNYNTYVGEKSGMRDVDPSDWDRWCEYILYKGLRRTGYARISRDTITDTELQVAKFQVGSPESTDDIVEEKHVPEDLRFPTMFRGQGVRGHQYHVFNEPRYYA